LFFEGVRSTTVAASRIALRLSFFQHTIQLAAATLAVTAEVASSSLAFPAILFKYLRKAWLSGVGTKTRLPSLFPPWQFASVPAKSFEQLFFVRPAWPTSTPECGYRARSDCRRDAEILERPLCLPRRFQYPRTAKTRERRLSRAQEGGVSPVGVASCRRKLRGRNSQGLQALVGASVNDTAQGTGARCQHSLACGLWAAGLGTPAASSVA
jgi:hypothetical protein